MTPPPSPADTLHAGRLAATSLLAAVVTLAGYGLALGLTTGGERGAPGVTVAVATLLAVPLVTALARLARTGAPVRWPYALAAALLAQAPLPLGGALMKLGDPLVSSHWRCGTGDATALILSPALALLGALGAFVAARWGVAALGARGARVVRGASLALLAAVITLTALLGAVAAARPQARALLAAMPVAGELPAVTLTPAMPVRFDAAGALLVWRRCDDSGCDLSLRQPSTPAGESLQSPTIRVGAEGLRVRLDRALDLAVFEHPTTGYAVGAFRARSGAPVDVTWGLLRGRVAPPLPWVGCAAAGLLLALAAFARTGGPARELRRWRAARPATLTAGATIRFEGDATAATVHGDAQAAPGPVLVFEDAARQPFREAASVPADAIRAGTPADLEAAIAVAEGGRFALAAAVAAWAALPLSLAALVVGAR